MINSFDPDRDNDLLIPRWLFPEFETTISVQLPYCFKNENSSFALARKIEQFCSSRVKVKIFWKTRKIRSLFPLKDKVTHKSLVIYEGTCSCGDKYIGETKRNVEVRWKEHLSSDASEPARHIKLNPGHKFSCKILCNAPSHWTKRRVLEAFFINKFKPSVNDQKDIKFLNLFRNGITGFV